MSKSINNVFSDWLILQKGGKDDLDDKVPAWIAINNGFEGSTKIHKRLEKFMKDRISASNVIWNPLDERHQQMLYSLREQFTTLNHLCRESVSDDELQAYQVLYA